MSSVLADILSQKENSNLTEHSLGPVANLLQEAYLLFSQPPTSTNHGALCYWLNNDVSLAKVKNFFNLLPLITNHSSPTSIFWPSWQKLPAKKIIQLANNEPLFLIATSNHWSEKIPSLKNPEKKLNLTVGERYSLTLLKKTLVDWDFSPSPQLSHPQTFFIQQLEPADQTIKQQPETYSLYPSEKSIIDRESLTNILPKQSWQIFSTTLLNTEIPPLPGQHLFFNPLPTKPASSLKTLPTNLAQFLSLKKTFWLTNNLEAARQLAQAKNLQPHFLESTKLITETGLVDNETIITTDADWHLTPPKKIRPNLQLIAELKPDDLVVHTDHGIGVFKKLAHRVIDGVQKEYVVVAYADNDTLFVPVEMSDRLEKYWGPANPTIHRLGATSSWQTEKAKAKAQAEQVAAELLHLAAQRELTQSPALFQHREQEELIKTFPYPDTPDQKTSWQEISQNLISDKPTDLLLCGDTGFGKTELAIRAAYQAILNKTQVAVLCPTTILAQQHLDTFQRRLGQFGVNIASLSRWSSVKEQRQTLSNLHSGQLDIIIGTQRLLSRDVRFNNLGLIIIDEEQRFGLKDKEHLKKIKTNAHILSLTATPIPRTLHLSLSGLKQLSVMATAPLGRLPIQTEITFYDEELIKKAIQTEVDRGGQVYFLHNEVATINLFCDHWHKLMPHISFSVAHGQMKPHELEKAMQAFDLGQTQVLICSSIIENGLDLPNANTLIVDNAIKFGLADLYQLRGRVGRGLRQAFAYFFYQRQKLTGLAAKRLQAILQAAESGSGWSVALRDLEIRGAGEVLGTKQHGALAAIGLGLYSKLLEEVITKIKDGVTLETPINVMIDLPIESLIPEELQPDLIDRLHTYQQLSNSLDLAQLDRNWHLVFPEKLSDYPVALQNFYEILQIKILAQSVGISQIQATTNNTELRLKIIKNEFWTKEQVEAIIKTGVNWEFKNNEIKKRTVLPNLLAEIKQLLKIL
ncbi:MAG: DEAD/DEAH box helicase [Candidatus Komeilibacteria bacterium]|nr:DEAD/DEAH box helicase [Candidatus Komeilibacteria bacterium]